MKILAVSDIESPYLWDHFQKENLKGADLILAAGDLRAAYLSFLVTMAGVPVLYVPGNHDAAYLDAPPEGCVPVDGKVHVHDGVRILGLGGCRKYNGGPFQYTEREMKGRVRRLSLRLKRTDGFDILLTHAPAGGFFDLPDPAHTGFDAFNTLIDTWHPAFHVHGHVHRSYGRGFTRRGEHGRTAVINACGYCFFDFPG